MFVDLAKIYVKAGRGGNGCLSFRHEKFVEKGGPDGGNGGKGGDVYLKANPDFRTLIDFHFKPHYTAEAGHHGQGSNKSGKSGKDLIINVPVGTVVKECNVETGEKELLADLKKPGQVILAAKAGRGGRGNESFKNSINQAPRTYEKGAPGEEKTLELELKIIADVGIIGCPNAGKSTLLSHISAARPKIADYPFTTLEPNLGVVRINETQSFIWADIPGLIDGAHEGLGLGHDFLRHIERTKVLVHVVDLAAPGSSPGKDYETINRELKLYADELSGKPQIVAANKIDLAESRQSLENFGKYLKRRKKKYFPVSAITGAGLQELIFAAWQVLKKTEGEKPEQETEKESVYEYTPRFTVTKTRAGFEVRGKEPERWIAMTDFNVPENVERLWGIFKKMGLIAELERMGIKEGNTILIKDEEFAWTKRVFEKG